MQPLNNKKNNKQHGKWGSRQRIRDVSPRYCYLDALIYLNKITYIKLKIDTSPFFPLPAMVPRTTSRSAAVRLVVKVVACLAYCRLRVLKLVSNSVFLSPRFLFIVAALSLMPLDVGASAFADNVPSWTQSLPLLWRLCSDLVLWCIERSSN